MLHIYQVNRSVQPKKDQLCEISDYSVKVKLGIGDRGGQASFHLTQEEETELLKVLTRIEVRIVNDLADQTNAVEPVKVEMISPGPRLPSERAAEAR